jgi:hypothetical protein
MGVQLCMLKIKGLLSIVLLLVTICWCGCKKLIEIDAPQTSVNGDNVYRTDVTAIAAITSMYATLSDQGEAAGVTGSWGLSVLAGLSADELTLYAGVTENRLNAYYKNKLLSTSLQNYGTEYWNRFYNYIFRCNEAMTGLSASNSLTPSVKQQLLGEAKFMRAFFYFYLVELYQNIPLALTADPTINASLEQSEKQVVLQQIIDDLKSATELLSPDFLNGNLVKYAGMSERLRPTKWAATALLARVYLYKGDYENAELQATAVINQSTVFALTALNNAFIKNSNEAIWQLQPVKNARNTEDGFIFILPATGPNASLNTVYLSKQLLSAFEPNDERRKQWVDSVIVGGSTFYYPYKYKATSANGPVTEYLMILRLAEQYLIRAEARVKLNNLGGAKDDLNAIRTRAGLANIVLTDATNLMNAILHERQVELFTELGQRWLDLKRSGSINTVMESVTALKGGIWEANWQLYPLPFEDIQRNANLQQNQGY